MGEAVGSLLGEAEGCGVGLFAVYVGVRVGVAVGALLGEALGAGVRFSAVYVGASVG